MANDSKASVYFTPTDSIDQTQLQLSPIHINYIRENMDSYASCMRPGPSTARQLFFQQRQTHSVDEAGTSDPMTFRTLKQTYLNGCGNEIVDDDDVSETESTVMIGTTENNSSNEDNCATQAHIDYIPMNILSNRPPKQRCDSKDLYYSLENVFDAKPSHVQPINDLTVDESSDVQMSNNSSASDNCIVDDEHRNTDWTDGKVTPEKDIPTNAIQSISILSNPSSGVHRYVHRIDSEPDFNELYPSSSLPNIKRTISAQVEVHCSKDHNGSHVSLVMEPSNTHQTKIVDAGRCNGITETV